MTDNQIIASCAALLAVIMIALGLALVRMNAIKHPTTDQARSMTLVQALMGVSIGSTVIVTAFLAYRMLALPLWLFLGIFG